MFKSAVLCVALAGTTASSVWLWHQWRNEREANVQLLARLATRQPQPKTPAPPPAATIAAVPASPAKINLPAESAIPDWRPDFRDGQRRLLANPEYRKSLRDRQRWAACSGRQIRIASTKLGISRGTMATVHRSRYFRIPVFRIWRLSTAA